VLGPRKTIFSKLGQIGKGVGDGYPWNKIFRSDFFAASDIDYTFRSLGRNELFQSTQIGI
jgi:hypothetical protein